MIAHLKDQHYSQAFMAHEASKPEPRPHHEPILRLARKGFSAKQIAQAGYDQVFVQEVLTYLPEEPRRVEFVPARLGRV